MFVQLTEPLQDGIWLYASADSCHISSWPGISCGHNLWYRCASFDGATIVNGKHIFLYNVHIYIAGLTRVCYTGPIDCALVKLCQLHSTPFPSLKSTTLVGPCPLLKHKIIRKFLVDKTDKCCKKAFAYSRKHWMKLWNQSITLVEQLLFIPSLQLNVCFK